MWQRKERKEAPVEEASGEATTEAVAVVVVVAIVEAITAATADIDNLPVKAK